MTTPLTQLASPVLVIGPAYAGKSELANAMLAPDKPAVIVGTADANEPAFRGRLAFLRSLRPPPWQTIECGADLAGAFYEASARAPQVLVDAIGQWVAGLLVFGEGSGDAPATSADAAARVQAHIQAQTGELLRLLAAPRVGARFVLVTSEAGAGPPPQRAADRLYRQALGGLNRHLAAQAASVVQVVAGLPQILKGG